MNPAKSAPVVSVVIPNYNGAAYLETCLRSLQEQDFRLFETIVVDNASDDNSPEIIARIAPETTVLSQSTNTGFSAAVNTGIRAARGEWVAVLNNDTEVAPDWLSECVRALQRHPDADFLACKIMEFARRNRVYSAGDCFLRAGLGYRRGQKLEDRDEYGRECGIFGACGCAALYRRAVLESLHGFDEHFFAYLEDVDLALRLHATGHCGIYAPRATVYHRGGATSGGELSTLAVRLHTRNAILLLIKNFTAGFLFRCLPMILLAQAFWLVRVLANGRLLSYMRGVAAVFPLVPAMVRERKTVLVGGAPSADRLWNAILASESLARPDGMRGRRGEGSVFLRVYFRLFRASGAVPGTA